MNILFLSSTNPADINVWSGTLYHMWNKLKEKHTVSWIGGELLPQADIFAKGNFEESAYLERYTRIYGKLLSERVKNSPADLLFKGDINFVPHLSVDIPLVYLSDVTYHLFKDFAGWNDPDRNAVAEQLEQKTLQGSASLLFSSEWAKQNAVDYYGIDAEKIHVVEFGANLPTPRECAVNIDTSVCHLVFIGKDWEKKGGDKVLEAYRKLKAEGFRCTLTVIGSVPEARLEEDQELTVIPFLDKSKPEELETLCGILARSHLLVLPTQYDAFGIVFCEASAYGVPSITADVCGVSQPVREGKNGYLLPPEATAGDYAEKIKAVFSDTENYLKLRAASRREFETRLNWHVWGERVDQILEETVRGYKEKKTTEEIKTGI